MAALAGRLTTSRGQGRAGQCRVLRVNCLQARHVSGGPMVLGPAAQAVSMGADAGVLDFCLRGSSCVQ